MALLAGVLQVLASVIVGAQQPAPTSAGGAVTLDFEFFKSRVQPILLHKREGLARCYVCHSQGTPLVIQELSPGATMWNEEQSRKNFEVIRRVVVPGNPTRSRLLHPGGKHWASRTDPEFQVLVAFANGARP
jgi:hypothetical protein